MSYTAPVEDMAFALEAMAGLSGLADLPGLTACDADLARAVLEEAGKLAGDVLAPLNAVGDREGARLTPDGVVAATGFREAYAAFRDGGWMGVSFPEVWGGQGLPKALALCVMEMVHGANMAFGLCPLLSFGAIEALLAHGTPQQQAMYLPKLVAGEWTGTMNLTEPQAGSDVGALTSRAVPLGDGRYAITGQKIYITWGDHDLTPNIIHLVLARLPDAPEGSRGVSLFLVPKFHVGADGTLGARNAVRCIGLEHKIGIHASPTCVMEFAGAEGVMIGEPNKGLACMFTMMNSARLNVGLEGVGVGEAAAQAALHHARERKQGRAEGVAGPAPILHHADVRRMIGLMQARVMAARAVCLACGVAADRAHHGGDQAAGLREDLLVPIAKAWSTDMGVEVASLGVQVHGGMGFMNEMLAAQLYRDARIAPIYEGTNGIQAIDLVGRKIARDRGEAMRVLIAEMREDAGLALASGRPGLKGPAQRVLAACDALATATEWMAQAMAGNARERGLAGASAYLAMAGDTLGGALLLKGAHAAHELRQQNRMEGLLALYDAGVLSGVAGRLAGVTQTGDALASAGLDFFDA
jgi:alkylation response protein AidB-like acyl-CoA dehydrogenase